MIGQEFFESWSVKFCQAFSWSKYKYLKLIMIIQQWGFIFQFYINVLCILYDGDV